MMSLDIMPFFYEAVVPCL